MKNIIDIAIIGMGPRGVTVLERLAAIMNDSKVDYPIRIHIIEKGKLGEGIHFSDQPHYLILNTVCSQITFFCDDTVKNAGPKSIGPSFFEWIRAKGYKRNSFQQISTDDGVPIEPNDYLPRAIFGEYLHEIAMQLIEKLRHKCTVLLYSASVQDIQELSNQVYQLRLSTLQTIKASYLFITTGHTTNEPTPRDRELENIVTRHQSDNSKLAYIAHPYPIHKIADSIDKDTVVAIEGFGLTSMDLLAAFTIGKGGRFLPIDNQGHLIYQRSKSEPKLIIYSLDNLPLNGRAINQKGVNQQYKAKFLTRERIDELRKIKGKGDRQKLDFELDLLPEIIKEIYYCYYTKWLENHFGEKEANDFSNDFIGASKNEKNYLAVINFKIPKPARLDWNSLFNPFHNISFASSKDFQRWIVSYLEHDLAECYLGNVNGPYKACCDVLRDIRDNIRYAIDFSGLTPESHKIFLEKYMPFMNRISVGPPKERIAQILALIDAGILDIGVGPQPKVDFDEDLEQFRLSGLSIKNNTPRYADVIIKARIHAPLPMQDQSMLMKNCLRRGLLTPFYNGNFHPGGILIDKNLHPIDKNKNTKKRIWAIGTLVEGPKFYTYIVPRSGVNSTGLQDAGKAVLAMFKDIQYSYMLTKNDASFVMERIESFGQSIKMQSKKNNG